MRVQFLCLAAALTQLAVGAKRDGSDPDGPTDPGINAHCQWYEKAENSGYDCQHFATSWSVTLLCGPTAPTSLLATTQDGIAADCNKYYKVKLGDQRPQIASDAHISLDDLYRWNPAVQTDCRKLISDFYVCTGTAGGPSKPPPATTTTPANGIATPTPIQAGMVGYCTKFYRVVSNDGCWQIARDNNTALDSLYRWNPAVKNDCTGLQANTYICIGADGFHIRSRYHNDGTGDMHNDNVVPADGGVCTNTDCQVASLDIASEGACPDGEVQISYWENQNCQGKWFGYGYTNRGTCRGLWTEGWKFKSLHLRCAKKDDCVSQNTCKEDPEPSNNVC